MPDTLPVPIDPRRCVVIPSYNSGPLLAQTVRDVMACWRPVIVVIDGSTDGSDGLPPTDGLHILHLPTNQGKGAAVLAGFSWAIENGFTHAATFDADGQHRAADIARFMASSLANPDALISGVPVFGPDAPRIRVIGHRVANFWAGLATSGEGPRDSLCGFRVYPLDATTRTLGATPLGRGFDFETMTGILLAQRGIYCIDLPTPIRYARQGISHFRYGRDNFLLVCIHARLLALTVFRRLHVWRKKISTPAIDPVPHTVAPE
ncbi:MAG: glycosyltransferase family 2 protein [Chthoniobacterales bacterium]